LFWAYTHIYHTHTEFDLERAILEPLQVFYLFAVTFPLFIVTGGCCSLRTVPTDGGGVEVTTFPFLYICMGYIGEYGDLLKYIVDDIDILPVFDDDHYLLLFIVILLFLVT